MDDVGKIVGEIYRIDRCLGTGRFSSVYAATHLHENQQVALKIFKEQLVNKAGGKARLLGGTKMASKPPHPAIVAVRDRGFTDEGVPFVVTDLLDGRTVQREVEENGPLVLERCLHLATVMLEALAAVHRGGNTHRSINSNNIFLCASGPPVRLLDYGLAKDMVDSLGVSPDVIGQTRYMAPEFLLNRAMTWTPSIDVFSAGMVLFFVLTGKLPFATDERHIGDAFDAVTINIYRAMDGEHPGPAELSPLVLPAIDAVVRRAIAINQSDRYANAGEMLAGLTEAQRQCDYSPGRGPSRAREPQASTPSGAPLPRYLMPPPEAPEIGNRAIAGSSIHPRERSSPNKGIDPLDAPTLIDADESGEAPTIPVTRDQLPQLAEPPSYEEEVETAVATMKAVGSDQLPNLFDPMRSEGVDVSEAASDDDDDQSTNVMSTDALLKSVHRGQTDGAATEPIAEALRADTVPLEGGDLFKEPEGNSQSMAEDSFSFSHKYQDNIPTKSYEEIKQEERVSSTQSNQPLSLEPDEIEQELPTKEWDDHRFFRHMNIPQRKALHTEDEAEDYVDNQPTNYRPDLGVQRYTSTEYYQQTSSPDPLDAPTNPIQTGDEIYFPPSPAESPSSNTDTVPIQEADLPFFPGHPPVQRPRPDSARPDPEPHRLEKTEVFNPSKSQTEWSPSSGQVKIDPTRIYRPNHGHSEPSAPTDPVPPAQPPVQKQIPAQYQPPAQQQQPLRQPLAQQHRPQPGPAWAPLQPDLFSPFSPGPQPSSSPKNQEPRQARDTTQDQPQNSKKFVIAISAMFLLLLLLIGLLFLLLSDNQCGGNQDSQASHTYMVPGTEAVQDGQQSLVSDASIRKNQSIGASAESLTSDFPTRETNSTVDPLPDAATPLVKVRLLNVPERTEILVDDIVVLENWFEGKAGTEVRLDVRSIGRHVVKTIEITEEMSLDIGEMLGPARGYIRVLSHPQGAAVYLNGRQIGVTPIMSRSFEAGTYALRLRHEAFPEKRQTVTIRPGRMTKVSHLFVRSE